MRRIIIVLFACCLIWGCKKKDDAGPAMPSPTQTGQNIVAYKANGKIHIYKGKHSTSQRDGVEFYRVADIDTYVYVWAESSQYQDDMSITIYGLNIEKDKEYNLSTEDNWGFGKYMLGNGSDVYKTKNGSGYIKFIRYDSSVAAGNFSMTVYNSEGKKVEITEGFFDIAVK
jgi:hypothetical protein